MSRPTRSLWAIRPGFCEGSSRTLPKHLKSAMPYWQATRTGKSNGNREAGNKACLSVVLRQLYFSFLLFFFLDPAAGLTAILISSRQMDEARRKGDPFLQPIQTDIQPIRTASIPRESFMRGLGYAGLKRVFDVVMASLFLLLAGLPMLLIALVVKLDSPGPVLYRQKRI